ncbi:MAG: hypothetical protein J6Y48_06135 [Clostridia bacterium]|nr:hypothetical protein [Clostridia bacterium]
MAGSRRKKELTTDFWCISCGKKGIPIMRDRCYRREQGHRKGLYCITCKTVVNHIETRNIEEEKQFLEDFAAGKYKEEAEKSILFAKENKL